MPQNPNPQYYRREKMSPNGNRWSFSFDSIADYDKFIADTTRTAIGSAKTNLDYYGTGSGIRDGIRAGGQRWFGTTNANEIKSSLDTFLYRADLQRVLSNITNRINSINLADIDQQKSIKFTEQEIGIFSFDLASLGLIKVFEYYSPLTNEIVNPNLVQSYKNANGQTVYYFVGQKYVPAGEIEYNFKSGGFYNAALDKNIPRDELSLVEDGGRSYYKFKGQEEIPRHDVERRQKLNPDGSKKFATTFKKCFVHIPKVEKPLPRIDIIVPFSFSGSDDADTLKFNAVPSIALAESLSRIGINYRLVATYPTDIGGVKVYQYIVLKKEGEALDKNKLALFIGDPRYYRFQRFRGIMSAYSDIDRDSIVGDGNWRTIQDNSEIKDNYVQFLRMSNNTEDVEASKRINSKIVQRPVSTEAGAVREYERIIDIIKSL
jgi:hypothetical protein